MYYCMYVCPYVLCIILCMSVCMYYVLLYVCLSVCIIVCMHICMYYTICPHSCSQFHHQPESENSKHLPFVLHFGVHTKVHDNHLTCRKAQIGMCTRQANNLHPEAVCFIWS